MADPVPTASLSHDADGASRLSLTVGEDDALTDVLEVLHGAVGELEAAAGEIRALLVHGSTPGPVLPPWRLAAEEEAEEAEEAAELALAAQRVLRRLELLPIPTFAAIDGACLGNGLELALACSWRVAADSPRVQLGLPQVRAGLIPGLGATVRLPRLIGVQAALELVLSARPVDVRRARALGLVDVLLPPRDFLERARELALERAGGRGARGRPRRRIGARLLEETAPGRQLVLSRAARRLLPAVSFAAPAPERAMERVVEGVGMPLEEAFRAEAMAFGALAAGERARALAHASAVVRSAGGGGSAARAVEQAAVIGAGGMGSDLAYLIAAGEVPVRLKDVRRGVLEEGLHRARRRLAEEIRGGRISEGDADRRDALLTGGTGWGGFGTVDMVIVAADGGANEVAAALRLAEEHTREECVMAFVSPRLTAAAVQEGVGRPAQVLALHPTPPVDRFPLLELAAGPRTAPETVAIVRRLARRLGHTALLVADRPGGLVNRLLGAWLAEAARLVEEGAGVEQVDRAAQQFGFVLGPFRRMDAIGVARVDGLLRALAAELGERFDPAPPIPRVAARGETFYRYRAGAVAGPNPALPPGFRGEDAGLATTLRERLLLVLLNEAACALQDGVADAAAVDVASLLGIGFPRALGGLLYHADQIGAAELADRLHDHAARFGARFGPAPLLLRLAAEGTRFSGHLPGGVL